MTYTHEEDMRVILVPVIGALNYHSNSQKEEFVKSEQVKIIDTQKELPYTVNNPFDKDWINYLHIGFKINSALQPSSTQQIEFKLDELISLNFERQFKNQSLGYIGIYNGRSTGSYVLQTPGNGIFVYIIKGAFDVHGRLLEYRDGLSLWNTQEIEFEALSNNATIMVLEISLK
jgi:hypothetical protein